MLKRGRGVIFCNSMGGALFFGLPVGGCCGTLRPVGAPDHTHCRHPWMRCAVGPVQQSVLVSHLRASVCAWDTTAILA